MFLSVINAAWNLVSTVAYITDFSTWCKITHIISCILGMTLFSASIVGLAGCLKRQSRRLHIYHHLLVGHFVGMLTLTITHMFGMARDKKYFLSKCQERFSIGIKADDQKCDQLFVARVAVSIVLYLMNLVLTGHLILAIKSLYTSIAELPQADITNEREAHEEQSRPPSISSEEVYAQHPARDYSEERLQFRCVDWLAHSEFGYPQSPVKVFAVV